MKQLDGIADSMDMSLSKLREIVKDRKPGVLHVVLNLESEATSFFTDTTHPFRLIPWLLELDSGTALCNPMDCSTPSFLVLHYLLEFLKLISKESVIPSHHLILSPFSPPAFNLSQHQNLFQ